MLDGSLTRLSLAHELLDRAMAIAMLLAQQLRDGLRVDFSPSEDTCP